MRIGSLFSGYSGLDAGVQQVLGHVTAVPGLSYAAQLKALGNGVVPLQAAYALRVLGL